MAQYNYVALSKSGQKIKGSYEAASREEVSTYLHEQGLVVIAIDENIGLSFKRLGQVQLGGVPLKDRVIFVKQLSTMLSAGLPIIQALEILVQQATNSSLRDKLQKAYKDVESGASLSEAFSKQKSIFTELQISLLVAGEKSGTLNEVMLQIADDMQKSKEVRGKIVGAMIYPIILIVVMIAVLVMMLLFMIPAVKSLYFDFGVTELPGVTAFLVSLSDFVSDPRALVIIILVNVFGVVGLRYYYSTVSGRWVIDSLLLKVPVAGTIIEKTHLTQFNRLLAMLLRNGVSIVEALRVISKSMSNVTYKQTILESRDEVVKGSSLSVPLARGKVFPIIMVKMLATGEETGKLDKVAADMGVYYASELEEITANLTKLIEPFMLLAVGGMVAFLAVAVYLPLYQLGQYIS
ncbi:type II secretion system F family protein [Candidatus Dojkabacteria bacterium]|uniref:Type II secretion system F family protein n=1 Tax=Candidatus Dojkabacteria bacterium TaxID=2099670 RepID=A0A955L016_9BACT|nr:type II secretion system F family protein [Candidatus Dojkabacteria bacterium]